MAYSVWVATIPILAQWGHVAGCSVLASSRLGIARATRGFMIAFGRRSTMQISGNAIGAFGRDDWSMARFFGTGDDRGSEARVSWSTLSSGWGGKGLRFGVFVGSSSLQCFVRIVIFYSLALLEYWMGWLDWSGWLGGTGRVYQVGETGVLCGQLSALSFF